MIRRKNHPPLQGALIALEPSTGAIVALVGGRDYTQSQYNRATTAKRQPGSTFKPFVYLAAFEATFDDPALPPITPATVVEDAPTVFLFGRQEYAPQNYENDYKGYVTLRTALAHSLNNATVKVAEMVGLDRIADLWNRRFGMPSKVQPYPADRPRLVRGHAAGDGVRVQHPRQHGPQGAAGHRPQGHGREGQHDRAALPEPAPRGAAGVDVPRRQHDAQRDQQRHRRRRALDGLHRPTPPARRAPRTTCATPGSRGSRPTSSASSGSGSTTTRRRGSAARGRPCRCGSSS